MSYTCDRCGKEFETPIMVESGGVYGDVPHKEPASPCCNDSFKEVMPHLICRHDMEDDYRRDDDGNEWCANCNEEI